MQINLEEYIENATDEVIEECEQAIATVAGDYFQKRFVEKEFDGKPWPVAQNPRRRGMELIKTGNLRNSLFVEREPGKVTISFGKEPVVNYAQVHNEGFDGEVDVKAFTRIVKGKQQEVQAHTRHMRIPKRQFLGEAQELEQLLHEELTALAAEILNRK
jgi:phage gpG-like protein